MIGRSRVFRVWPHTLQADRFARGSNFHPVAPGSYRSAAVLPLEHFTEPLLRRPAPVNVTCLAAYTESSKEQPHAVSRPRPHPLSLKREVNA